MMWNWLVTALASGASLVLYDGSPFSPTGNVLWDYADEIGITLFGTSAKYIDALKKYEFAPKHTHKLTSLRTLCSTGSVLAPESFDYVYDSIKDELCLSSISGGTDIISCFVLGSANLPVRRGESQCRGLGMAVEVFNAEGEALRQRLHQEERQLNQAQLALQRAEDHLKYLRKQIENDFGLVTFETEDGVTSQEPLPFDQIVTTLPRVTEIDPEMKEEIQHGTGGMARGGRRGHHTR
jgi:acyl-coenzyme A synthetase/AMP-(fatty) acid ligase